MAHCLIVYGTILVISGLSFAGKYDNYTLLRLFARDDKQLSSIMTFEDPDEEVEVLKRSRGLNDSMDVLVPPDKMPFIKNFSQVHDLILDVKETDYARRLQFNREPKRRAMVPNPAFQYTSYDNMLKVLSHLEKNSDFLTVQYLGNSYQGRPLKLAKLSTDPKARNPIIFIDAGIHAREWVAPAMAMYMIDRMSRDPAAVDDMEGVDWYILPLVNPDGYEYTRTNPDARLWRKTMSQQTSKCFGVDGNRNYGFKWAVSGVSRNPCDRETFAGPRPFSEPETQIVKKVMLENADRIKLYVSMHAYGQYLVYPWGYTGDKLPQTWKKLDRLAKIVSAATVRAGGEPFKVLSAGKWYPAAGGSDDFAFGGMGIPYSYTMELTDGHEFIYPQQLLATTLPKFYQGFRAFGNEIRKEFSRNRRRKRDLSKALAIHKLHEEMDKWDRENYIEVETFTLFP